MSASGPGILFTSFEPSGDDHAAAVIAELKRRRPDLRIYAWGGPHMERAGAVIVERTGDNAVMGLPGIGKIVEHIQINRRVRSWLREGQAQGRQVTLHIPVDSPAANFPLCRIAKRSGIRVVHMVAPQVWAWGRWRIKKLRRLTDFVLCVLPFEENWFIARGVAARFVGHPLFDHPLDLDALAERARIVEQQVRESLGRADQEPETRRAGVAPGSAAIGSASGRPLRLALMPGSRPAEMRACLPILLDAYLRLKDDFPNTTAVIAATKPAVAEQLRQLGLRFMRVRAGRTGDGGAAMWPSGLTIVAGETDAVINWCDFSLVVSGTVTLQIAKQSKPMVAVYRPNWLVYWLIAKWIVSTEVFTLPNLIAGRRIMPELIPHFGDGEALAVEVIKLLRRPGYADDQREELRKVCELFRGKHAAIAAADEIERILGFGALLSFKGSGSKMDAGAAEAQVLA